MFNYIFKKIIGTKNARELKSMQPIVARINELEATMKAKSDSELSAMTPHFRERIAQGQTLDALLPEAFATVREAGRRVLNMRHYDVQLLGGMALHRGHIAEMKTGEGKTLVATLPVYLNALPGNGVHLVTVNDYLASRDAEWMGRLYRFLGLTVGTIYHDMPDRLRQSAYRSDITYGQNNEFGFDYLRDNMKDSIERYVQRPLNYAIVDEVDSILIDEARTPLIISGPAEQSADLYHRVNHIIPSLRKDVDFTVDEKAHSSILTDSGVERVERLLSIKNLYDSENLQWLHHVTQALAAHTLYKRDVNYLVEDGKVVIIDEHTGRKMPGRRWSDGLHQAIEAKENVPIEEENQTLATITFQNYFRMYNKLAGMTGTAETEAEEFYKIYKLEVTSIPTNKTMARKDADDVIYKTERAKFRAVIEDIKDCQKRGQPVLVGTTSVEKSEVVAKLLKKENIAHNVLNAKHHEREAEIVAQAGRKGAVTISTNMAGRGTDILLGGNAEFMARAEVNPETEPDRYAQVFKEKEQQCRDERDQVLAAGGLHILGTERHEARRIDNQLRGRAGRQGDPGSSKFYLSLEDNLLRIFGAERMTGLMERLGMTEDETIEHRFVNKAIENAQRKVEGHNFDIRKHLLEYDDVMSQQRKSIYSMRRQVLEGRYAPELTEAEKKAGKKVEVPTKSGDMTIDSLADILRPQITQIVEAHFKKPAQTIVETDADHTQAAHHDDDEASGHDSDERAPGANGTGPQIEKHQQLTHELYRFFGAVVDLRAESTDPDACIAKACRDIAASLIQQRERIFDNCDASIGDAIALHCPEQAHGEDWDIKALEEALKQSFNFPIDLSGVAIEHDALAQAAWEQVEKLVLAREAELGPIYFLYFARHFYLEEIDAQWIDHLKAIEQLREGIGLRGYGQKDPKQEYKKEGYNMFAEMMGRIQSNVLMKIFRVQLVRENQQELPKVHHKERKMVMTHGDTAEHAAPSGGGADKGGEQVVQPIRRHAPRIGRNDPCPCGSGKKYKKCHMTADEANTL